MPKMTLLEMTQSVLNDMDSEEVNSLTDTPEAMQVAQIIKTTYFDIIAHRDWPHEGKLITLTVAGTDRPTHMRMAEDVSTLEWVKYDTHLNSGEAKTWKEIPYVSIKEFMDRTMSRDSTATNVVEVTHDTNIVLNILNDSDPSFFTTIDDDYLIFDAWDNTADGSGSSMVAARTMAFGVVQPSYSSFTITDTYVPELPAKAFPYLLAESKSACFNALRQVANAKEEQKSRRHRAFLAREKHRAGRFDVLPDYSRGGRGSSGSILDIATGDDITGDSLPSWWPT